MDEQVVPELARDQLGPGQRGRYLGSSPTSRGGYVQTLQRHLGAYRSERLGVEEAGNFSSGGIEVPYDHILPKPLKWLNILEPIRREVMMFAKTHRPPIKLHKYFHHLNSSQAFALNLFFPFLEAEPDQSEVLIAALGLEGRPLTWEPESIVDAKEHTTVDIAWTLRDGGSVYCEVKLSEQEFGHASGDDQRHQDKHKLMYLPVLQSVCAAEMLESKLFFANYQILRNVWLVAREPASRLLFLMPERNAALHEPLRIVLDCLTPTIRARVHVAYVEPVLATLAAHERLTPALRCHVHQMIEKYVPA
jgi:hypothetical protein